LPWNTPGIVADAEPPGKAQTELGSFCQKCAAK
jgi:hypothetical protein